MLGGWKMKEEATSRNAWDGISIESNVNDYLEGLKANSIRILAPNKYCYEFFRNDFVGGN